MIRNINYIEFRPTIKVLIGIFIYEESMNEVRERADYWKKTHNFKIINEKIDIEKIVIWYKV